MTNKPASLVAAQLHYAHYQILRSRGATRIKKRYKIFLFTKIHFVSLCKDTHFLKLLFFTVIAIKPSRLFVLATIILV